MPNPRESRYKRLYDISVEEYDMLLDWQGGVCALCDRPPKTVRLSVDHDHKTGETRGLLCVRCNRMLREAMTAEWLKKALTYSGDTPPTYWALGRVPVGRVGRVTTKRRRPRRTKRLTSSAKSR